MDHKKGFTLVELLSVIGVLVLLIIVVLPNIIKVFRNAKKDAFILEVRNLYKAYQEENLIKKRAEHVYQTGEINMNGIADLEYSISTNKKGQIICFQVANTDYMWIFKSKGYIFYAY